MNKRISHRIALTVAYRGLHYWGWQRQRAGPSVQQHIEEALSMIANEPIEVFVSGRTDRGVHATAQVVHFDVSTNRPMSAWLRGGNSLLPPDIRVLSAQCVSDEFHARHSARWRTYQYFLWQKPVMAPWAHDGWAHHPHALDVNAMQQAANSCIGEHDFSAFRAAMCQSHSTHRCIRSIQIQSNRYGLDITITGNAFLHHMVRNMTGSLIWVGAGKRPVGWMKDLLAFGDRTLAGPTAPAKGLWLIGIDFDTMENGLGIKEMPYDWLDKGIQ